MNNFDVLKKRLFGIFGKAEQMQRDEMRLKKKKRMQIKRTIRKIFMYLLLGVFVAAIGVALSYTVFFKVSSIEINGSKTYPQKTVVKYCGVKTGDNLLSVNEEEVLKNLRKKLPYISSVAVQKKLPSTLIINVTEAHEVAAVPKNGRYILLDGQGRIVDKDASLLKGGVALIKGYNDISGEEGVVFSSGDKKRRKVLLDVLDEMDDCGLKNINMINLKRPSSVILQYDSRIKIRLGNNKDLETKMKRVAAAIKKEDEINSSSRGTLDLRSEAYSFFRAEK